MKKLLIVIILIISHISFFILIDRNRQSIKSLLVNIGVWNPKIYVFLQEKLTNKKSQMKSRDDIFLADMPKTFHTNHFNETHQVYDLYKIEVPDKENYTYGYVTSVEKKDNNFNIITNNGFLFVLNDNFEIKNFIVLKDYIANFFTDFAYGGIRGAKWVDNSNLIVYTTIKKNGLIYLSLISLNLEDQIKITDTLLIDQLPTQDGTTSNLGGGIEMQDNKIYLAIGTSAVPNEHEINKLAQDDNYKVGKILSIELYKESKHYQFNNLKIIGKGTRNSQGLKFINSKLYGVEHGPQGGDEINIINTNPDKILNYGWPFFSYGVPYHNKSVYNLSDDELSEKKFFDFSYNSYKEDYVVPYFYFTPSIAVSDIAGCPFGKTEFNQYKNCFVISSLKNESFYIMKEIKESKYQNKSKIISHEKVFVGNRIRKIYTELNTIYLFLDNLKVLKIVYNA